LTTGQAAELCSVTSVSSEFKRFISTRRQVPPPEGYISKPVDHEEFLKLVRELLQ
jgi:hypothetical protein